MMSYLLLLLPALTAAWNNGVALTPPMGFANWNLFGCNYTDATFREMSDAMVSTGLAGLGFRYMLIQECIVPAGGRDPSTGILQPDPVKFPYGIPSLVDYIHSKNLLAGIYTDVAYHTCAGYEGSGPSPTDPVGHWELDALTFAQWGLDLIEADFCNTEGINKTALELYSGARDAIAAATAATGKNMVFYQCNWGVESPWLWGPTVANLFRNTGDICSPGSIAWSNILRNFDATVVNSRTPPLFPGAPGTGIGAWNDPDMIGVGMPGINDIEGRSQFSLWCILGAPLFLGTDIRSMSAATAATLTNAEAIAIDQDPLGLQGMIVASSSPASIPWEGGLMLNLTADGGGAAPPAGTAWTFTPDGHIVNNVSGYALTVYACDVTPGTVVFNYQSVNDACNNELWSWGTPGSSTGLIVSQIVGNTTALCLAAATPLSSGPFSQLIISACDAGAPEQQWSWSAQTSTLSLQLSGSGGGCSLLQQFAPSLVNFYTKPLLGGDIALAVLNRGAAAMSSGALVDFGAIAGYAPAQRLRVRDIWTAQTLGPFAGNFTTRAIASHETLLFRLSLAQ